MTQDAHEKTPSENPLLNEPYERIDRLNYKDRADRHVDHQDQLFSRELVDGVNAQTAIVQQQREAVEDIRHQRDVMFQALMSERQQLFAPVATLFGNLAANSADHARDTTTILTKNLDAGAHESAAEAASAKIMQGLSPAIDNAVKAAVANAAIGGGTSVGQASLRQGTLGDLAVASAVTATNLQELVMQMAQATAALQAVVQQATEQAKND